MAKIVQRVVTITKGKLRRSKTRIGLRPPLFFVLFCLLGMIAGICVNNHYYALRKTHVGVGGEHLLTATPPVLQ
jgi:hypothetical protein